MSGRSFRKKIEKNSFGFEKNTKAACWMRQSDVLEKALIFHYRGRLCAVAFLTSFAKYFFGLRS